ncbi:MAG: DUF1707 domain-containing protein, partial [Propionibacteriaceae bacterium]|nr:DUF1707 domain-containing protein [Propionibacteriaceae bacterium]
MSRPRQQFRIGDVERDLTLNGLSDHFADARLDGEVRSAQPAALVAKTQRELDRVLDDLPGPRSRSRTQGDASKRKAVVVAMAACSALLTWWWA